MIESGTITSKNPSELSRWERFVRSQLFQKLEHIEGAQLIIKDADGVHQFGDKNARVIGKMTVHSAELYQAIASSGSVGAAEQYVMENWDSPDLTQLIEVFVLNQKMLDSLEAGTAWIKNSFLKLGHFFNRNSKSGSKKNISDHYDLGNDMFELFLDSKMMYSSAIFETTHQSLEDASTNKLKTICEKLELNANDHVIEIGTGWGGFAVYAAQNYGCKVTTTTISKEQYDYAKDQVKRFALEDKVHVLLKDYRDLEGKYDKLVSIEMIEAVGHQYLDQYLSRCNQLLKEDGQALIQAITIEDHRYKIALKSVDFIKKYIFPGSFIPSISEILRVSANSTELKLNHLHDIGKSYALTLNHWRQRFNDKSETLTELGYDESFQRLWNFYFCYCEGGFKQNSISTVQMVFTKPRAHKQTLAY